MQNLRLATIAVNQTPLDFRGNRMRVQQAIKNLLASCAADIILLPELSLSGYGCEDAFLAPYVAESCWQELLNLARACKQIAPGSLIFVGLPVRYNGRLYNCMAAIQGGRVHGLVPKRHLAGDGVHYEPRWFVADRKISQRLHKISDQEIPFGPLLFEYLDLRIAIEICEDAWVANRPALLQIDRGLDLVLNPCASHFAFNKFELRRTMFLEASRSLACYYAATNLLGNESGRIIFDGSHIIACAGKMIALNRGFAYTDSSWISVALESTASRTASGRFASHLRQIECSLQTQEMDRLNPMLRIAALQMQSRPGFLAIDEAQNESKASSNLHNAQEPIIESHPYTAMLKEPGQNRKYEEFLQAESLGLFDYLRRSQARGFALSLSGGADSAACAILVYNMLLVALQRLGRQACLQRLGRPDLEAEFPTKSMESEKLLTASPSTKPINFVEAQTAARILMPHILLTIYQASEHSSQSTQEAARMVARAIAANHHEAEITDLVEKYQAKASQIMGRTLSWDQDNISLQNIQARVRSPLVWFLANLNQFLLLTTGNRSETSVGYCTMDGDTSGGLAPIAGVHKSFIQNWLLFMQTTGPEIMGPMTALRNINSQQPTAELRPAADGQTDEGELMPYALLNRIETLAIRDGYSPAAILQTLSNSNEYAIYKRADLIGNIRKYFTLWSRNQWKRERLAPAFHLDDYNLDPRSWYRFPILNSGFQSELEDLI